MGSSPNQSARGPPKSLFLMSSDQHILLLQLHKMFIATHNATILQVYKAVLEHSGLEAYCIGKGSRFRAGMDGRGGGRGRKGVTSYIDLQLQTRVSRPPQNRSILSVMVAVLLIKTNT